MTEAETHHHHHHHHHHSYQRNLPHWIACGVLLAAELFTSALLIFAILKLNILPTWAHAIIIGVLVLVFAYNVFKLCFHKKAKLFGIIASGVLAILISGGCLFAYSYIQQANDFISGITGIQEQTVRYEIRVLKSANIATLSDLKGKKIGFIADSPNLTETKATLKKDLEDFEAVDYETIGALIEDAYESKISAFIVSDSYLEFLEDSDYDIENDTTVLHEVRFKVAGKSDLRLPVNVTQEPFIVYISGSDSRGTINDVSRSDVNILAVVNPAKGKILLVNIPRDYYVQLHGTTGLKDKLTHAGLYGIDMSKSTIEDLLDIKINYTIRVGFQAIEQFVNAIDGIDIDSDMQVKTGVDTGKSNRTCYIKKGRIHLDGACALAYSRHRKTLKDGDLDRGKHQQQVLTAIIDKITNLHYVTRYSEILNAAKGTFQTSFTESEISDFIRFQLGELKSWKVESIQVGNNKHILTPTYTIRNENLWVYLPDEASENVAKQKIAEYLAK